MCGPSPSGRTRRRLRRRPRPCWRWRPDRKTWRSCLCALVEFETLVLALSLWASEGTAVTQNTADEDRVTCYPPVAAAAPAEAWSDSGCFFFAMLCLCEVLAWVCAQLSKRHPFVRRKAGAHDARVTERFLSFPGSRRHHRPRACLRWTTCRFSSTTVRRWRQLSAVGVVGSICVASEASSAELVAYASPRAASRGSAPAVEDSMVERLRATSSVVA